MSIVLDVSILQISGVVLALFSGVVAIFSQTFLRQEDLVQTHEGASDFLRLRDTAYIYLLQNKSKGKDMVEMLSGFKKEYITLSNRYDRYIEIAYAHYSGWINIL